MPGSSPSLRILVGIDGTNSGLDALALGRALAALTEAPLVLAAVHGYETFASLFGGPGWPTSQGAWAWLRRAALDVGGDERFRLVTIDAGSVAHGLALLAAREGANLIVVGTSTRGAGGRLRTGTGARRVVRDARCPVAVAPAGWRAWSHAGRPVFGVSRDSAGEAPGALEWARALAAAAGAAVQPMGSDQVKRPAADPDLLVVGSHPYGPLGAARHAGAPAGRACPVLIVPAGSPAPPQPVCSAAAARG